MLVYFSISAASKIDLEGVRTRNGNLSTVRSSLPRGLEGECTQKERSIRAGLIQSTSDRNRSHPPNLRCIGQQLVKRFQARRSELQIHFQRSRESNKHESNAPGRRRTRNIGCDRFGLRRFYRHSRKEDRRYRADPSLQERARNHPDSSHPVLGWDWRRCRPDFRWFSQNGLKETFPAAFLCRDKIPALSLDRARGDTKQTRIGVRSIARALVKDSMAPATPAPRLHPLIGRRPALAMCSQTCL